MKSTIIIPFDTVYALRRHFFQNELEQGAFLFSRPERGDAELRLVVEDSYLVPPRGWEVQMEVYLQMRDSERAKIMKLARDRDLAAIDCHSHPNSGENVWFSPSDIAGITEFAQYAKWKLDGRPFAAMVWGEKSVDAVMWQAEFAGAEPVTEVQIIGTKHERFLPRGSWFRSLRGKHRFSPYE